MTDKPVHRRIAEDRTHYLAHPDDDEWEEAPPTDDRTARLRPQGAMVSVRLSAEEAEEIRAAADIAGRPVSGFMRQIVLDRIRNKELNAQVSMVQLQGNSNRVVTDVELQPGVPVSGGVQSRHVA
jgi:uncharacterized protein (DUF1778 family)